MDLGVLVNIGKCLVVDTISDLFLPHHLHEHTLSFVHACLGVYYVYTQTYSTEAEERSYFSLEDQQHFNFSCAYFLYDLVKMCVTRTHTSLMVSHHLITLYFYYIVQKYNLRNVFVNIQLVGEGTGPLYQVWSVLKKHYPSSVAFRILNHTFTMAFLVFRLLIIPRFCCSIFWPQLNAKINNPVHLRTLRALMLLFNFGNIVWAWQLCKGYSRWLTPITTLQQHYIKNKMN